MITWEVLVYMCVCGGGLGVTHPEITSFYDEEEVSWLNFWGLLVY